MARIVHVSESLATGVLAVLRMLIVQQVRDGHEVVLIGSPRRADTPAEWRRDFPRALTFIDLPMEREIEPFADLRSVVQLRRKLAELEPDVVHLHSSKAGAIGRVAALGLGARVIYQPHGLAYLRRDVSSFRRTTFAALESGLALLGGTVVACSEGEHAALRGVVPVLQSAVVENGIDVHDLPRALHAPGRLRIGTSGRISPQKRPAFFAQVAEALGGRADFVWIGDGDEALKRPLHEAGVEITGWCSRTEALETLATFHIYVQTSAWEGLPVAVIEAMAAGLPVVATNIVGNRDLLRGTGAGLLVDTPPQMIAALLELMDDPEARVAAGDEGSKIVRERYSSAAMVKNFYGLYALDRPRLSPARRIADVAREREPEPAG